MPGKLLYGGTFDVVVRGETDLSHVYCAEIQPDQKGNITVQVEKGGAFLEDTGIHLVLPGNVHFGFVLADIKKICTPDKKLIWKPRKLSE